MTTVEYHVKGAKILCRIMSLGTHRGNENIALQKTHLKRIYPEYLCRYLWTAGQLFWYHHVSLVKMLLTLPMVTRMDQFSIMTQVTVKVTILP